MAFAGNLGMAIHLDRVPTSLNRNDKILFSESNSRFLVEVDKGKQKEFEKIIEGNSFARIGEVTEVKRLVIIGLKGNPIVEEDINELKKVWKSTFDW